MASNLGVDISKIYVINPGCYYPLEISEDAKNQAKESLWKFTPK